MGWHISCVNNDVLISDDCAQELLARFGDRYDWQDVGDVVTPAEYGNVLHLNDDWMEHMDYLWQVDVQAVLVKHGCVGDICFASLDGDNAGSCWGYRFVPGGVVGLTGRTEWAEDGPAVDPREQPGAEDIR